LTALRRNTVDNNIKSNDLPEPYKTICRIVGLSDTLRLAKELGGSNIYFPTLQSVTRFSRDELIFLEFKGDNYKDIARCHGLSETHVRRIIERMKKVHRPLVKDIKSCEQLSLFSLVNR
jgi:hypothetical protein